MLQRKNGKQNFLNIKNGEIKKLASIKKIFFRNSKKLLNFK